MDRAESINNQLDSSDITSIPKRSSSIKVSNPKQDSAEEIKPQIKKKPGQIKRSRIPILSYCPSTPSTSVPPLRTVLPSQSLAGAKAYSKIPFMANKTVAPVTNEIKSPVSNRIRLPIADRITSTVLNGKKSPVLNGLRSSDANGIKFPVANKIRPPVANKLRSPVAHRVLSPIGPNYPSEKLIPKEPKTAPIDGREECRICHRLFVSDRLIVHEKICKKVKTKKRKPFDPVMQRIQGTDAEPYLKLSSKQQAAKQIKKLSWRKQHEEFIIMIRATKEAQAYVAKGGKLCDLPPLPPSDTSHYIPCPHCRRKFNQTAAARHIPKCAEMVHNKPKPKTNQSKVVPNKRRIK